MIQLDADNDELVIYGGYDTYRFLSSRRRQLSEVRSEKALITKRKKEREKNVFKFKITDDESFLEKELSDALILLDDLSANSNSQQDTYTIENNIEELEEHSQSIKNLISKIQTVVVSKWGDAETKRIGLIINANDVLDLIDEQLRFQRAKLLQEALQM